MEVRFKQHLTSFSTHILSRSKLVDNNIKKLEELLRQMYNFKASSQLLINSKHLTKINLQLSHLLFPSPLQDLEQQKVRGRSTSYLPCKIWGLHELKEKADAEIHGSRQLLRFNKYSLGLKLLTHHRKRIFLVIRSRACHFLLQTLLQDRQVYLL